jgi:GntR family transcriptional regulator / MocR family aminotransferase
LARDLAIGRGSVVDAYAQLVCEGWLITRQGAPTRVAAVPIPEPMATRPQGPLPLRHDLRPGHVDPASFPRRDWASAVRQVLTDAPDEALDYADPRGRVELRNALAGYLGRARGVRCSADVLMVCTGAAHGMGLAFRNLAAAGGRRIAVENPSSPRLPQIAAAAGLQVVSLPCDEHGARIDEVPRLGVDAVMVTPAHQYPLGVTLAPERRTALVRWARSTGAVVIEDDYDGELRYDRQSVGALQALDPEHVPPALRIGWLALPPTLRDAVITTSELINAAPSSLEQLAFARLIERGLFDRHIRRMRGLYRARRDLLVATLARHAPELRVTGISAGGHALVRLPAAKHSEADVVTGAAEHGIALTGVANYCRGHDHEAAAQLGPALVIGYATPVGHSHRAAITALGHYLASTA